MRLMTSGPQVLLLLSLGTALSGCSTVESGFASATGWMSGFGPSWGGMRPAVPSDSLTVQRIRNQTTAGAVTPLTTEPGDVWPRDPGPRATLANPDEALRGFRTGEEVPPGQRRRGSAGLPAEPIAPAIAPAMPAFDPPPPPPPSANRTDGQTIFTPSGPVTTTGGSSRVQTTISPQGSGVAIREGNVTTIIGPNGQVQQVPTPR